MMLSAGNGFIMQSEKYSRDNAGQSLKKYILLKKGELAYNHGASKARQYGCCYELTENEARIPYVYHCFKVCETEYTPYIAIALNNTKSKEDGIGSAVGEANGAELATVDEDSSSSTDTAFEEVGNGVEEVGKSVLPHAPRLNTIIRARNPDAILEDNFILFSSSTPL